MIQQFVIKGIKVFKESALVKLDEFLLDRAIKALGMRIYPGALGIGHPEISYVGP
jgi:hypothetical protein